MGYFAMNNPDGKSSTMLNAIKGSATPLYQARIPDATSENLAEVGSSIENDPTTYNEYVKSILDRIGKVVIRNMTFRNPLESLKKGFLNKGKIVEEIHIDLINAKAYDPRQSFVEIEKRELPNIKAVFHVVNRADKYKTTVEEETLSMAFTSEEGFGLMIDKIIDTLMESNQVDEFELMKGLIRQNGVEGKLHVIQVPDPVDTATAKKAISTIRKSSDDFTFPDTSFNYAGVTNTAKKEKQILLMNTAFNSIQDVEVLASAFNMEKTEFMGRRIVVNNFGGLENVVAMLMNEDWFMVYDKKFKTKSRENEDGLYWNYWLHVWQTMSTSPFANAIIYQTVAPILDSIDLRPDAVSMIAGGDPVTFTVEPTGSNYPSAQCTFEHNGTSEHTVINSIGQMYVGEDELTSPITVTATSTFDVSKTDSSQVTVTAV